MRGVYHGCAVICGPQKMAAIMSSGARVAPRAPKSIDDDVIGCACAVMGLEDDSSVWSYPPAHTTYSNRKHLCWGGLANQDNPHRSYWTQYPFFGCSVRPTTRRDVPVGVPLDLSTVMEWHELPKYNGIQVSQLIYPTTCIYLDALVVCLENNFHLLHNDTRTLL